MSADPASRRWFLGTQSWIRVGTDDSNGSLAVIESLIPPGGESPWHVHHTQDETFYLVEGAAAVTVGDERRTLAAGDCAFLPRAVPHGFRIEGDAPARVILVCTPGDGFDVFIRDASEPATSPGFPPPQQPDIARIAQLAARCHNEILGPLPR